MFYATMRERERKRERERERERERGREGAWLALFKICICMYAEISRGLEI